MKRALAIAAGLVLLAAAGWLLWPSSPEPSEPTPGVAPVAAPLDEASARALRFGSVAGVVERDGRSVEGARVVLRVGSGMLATVSGPAGGFLLEDVPAGEVYLSATAGDAASEVLGPIRVEAGTRVDGLRLALASAVSIEGVVVDVVTRAPVRGAVVLSSTGTAQTDQDGRFTMRGVRDQAWLDISAPGYLTRAEWVSLQRGGGRLELVLTPAARIEGVVLEGGAPVGGATVWAEQATGLRRGERSPAVFTDKEGRFVLEVAHGLLRLGAATPRGTRVRGPELVLAIGERRQGVVLDAADASAVSGVVTRDGVPLPGAQLSIVEAGSGEVTALATTGPDGRFQVGALQNGRYVVQVRHGAWTAVAGPYEQRGDGVGWTVAVSGGAVLAGRVVPPGAGVRVHWRSGDWAGPVAETVTGADGRFRFEGVPAGLISVDAEGPAGSATVRARAGDEVVLTLQRGAVVVHVQDDSGAALNDGVLVARSLETGAVRRYLLLAPGGVMRLELPTGPWELFAEATGRGRSVAARVDVTAAGADVFLSIEVGVVARGRVVDSATQLPIAGARVLGVNHEVNDSRVAVVTDARGEYQLPPVSRGATISVWHPQYRPVWQPASAALGGRVDFTLVAMPHPMPEAAQFEGVGMVLRQDAAQVLVDAVNEGGPAERAGVQRGDAIVAVDGVPTGPPVEQVVGRIRGPAGTIVRVTFERGGQRFELPIRRQVLHL